MTAQSLVCATCDADVPRGRLSCPACGALLASVSGGRRIAPGAVTTSATPAVLYEPDAAPTAGVVDGELESARAGDLVVPSPDERAADEAIDDETADDEPDGGPAERPPATSAGGPAGPWSEAPGAYLPPAFRPPPPILSTPAGPAAPARAWAGQGAPTAMAEATASASQLPVERPRVAEFVGWLSVAGAALAAVGFLLPWSSAVIGASGVGYFDRWGLAGPFHVVVVLGLLAILALSLVRHSLPTWLAVGLPGLGLGALLVGLVWPYVLGPLGAGAGVVIVGLGAVMLAAAGMVAIGTDRHASGDPAV